MLAKHAILCAQPGPAKLIPSRCAVHTCMTSCSRQYEGGTREHLGLQLLVSGPGRSSQVQVAYSGRRSDQSLPSAERNQNPGSHDSQSAQPHRWLQHSCGAADHKVGAAHGTIMQAMCYRLHLPELSVESSSS